jgi:hypothetical protein
VREKTVKMNTEARHVLKFIMNSFRAPAERLAFFSLSPFARPETTLYTKAHKQSE